MSFLYPYVLIALVLPVLMAVAAIVLHHRAGKSWRMLVSPQHKDELVCSPPIWRTVVPPALAFLALAAAILAAARPINGYSEAGAVATSRNLIIALDVSRSMETRDVSPSRLDQAKAAAVELIQALPTDKIGLIVFSGEADMVVPLTYDHNALIDTINQVDRTWVEYGGTNLSLVLHRAMLDFKRSAPDGTNAVVILSDGEETEDSSLETIAKNASKRHILVIAVGVGTPTGDTIPDPREENGLWKDANGKHVISKLQPKTLHKLAEQTGGDFVLMNSGTNLSEFARHAANKIDRHEEQAAINKVPNDLFASFALAALVLLVAAILLATDWSLPRRAVACIPPLLAMGLAAPSTYAAEAEDYLEEDAQAIEKMSHAEHYATGLAYLKEKKIDKAKEAFSRALLSEDKALQAASLYALGNLDTQATFSKLRDLYTPKEKDSTEGGEDADATDAPPDEGGWVEISPEDLQGIAEQLKKDKKSYEEALVLNPELKEARSNLGKVQQLIGRLDQEAKRLQEELEKQEQQNDKKDGEGQQNQQQKQQGQQNQQQQGKQNQRNQQQQGNQNQQSQQQQGQQNQQSQQQQGQQNQQSQQQQGKQGKEDSKKDKQQDAQNKDRQEQDQQQDQQQDDSQDKQGEKGMKEKLDDFINSMRDEIDRLKEQQKQKRTPKQRKEDAQDLIDKLKDELQKLKDDAQNQEGGKEQKDAQGKDKNDKDGKQKEDKDGERKDDPSRDGKDGPPKGKEDMDKAMDLARQLEKELRDMREEAEKKQREGASPEEKQELDEADKAIRDLKDEIRRLKLAQKNQEKQEENKDAAPALSPEKEKEKAEQRAEGILRMNLDEESGSPIPSTESRTRRYGERDRRPRKDY